MAFPTIVSTGSTANLSVTVSGSVTMPSGIVAGNLLLLFTQCTGVNGYTVGGSSWTTIASAQDSSGASILICSARIATGSDTATIVPGDASAHSAAAFCFQISGWNGALADVEGVASNPGTTALGTLDPPNLSAAYTRDNLWFAFGAGTGAPTAITAAPTNYSGLTKNGYGSNAGTLCYATRNLNAASENPGTFTGNLQARINMTVSVSPREEGAAALSATSTLTVAGVPIFPAASALSATSTLTVAGTPTRPAGAALAATSTLTVAGVPVRPAAAALAATSTLTVAAITADPDAHLAAASTLTVGAVANAVGTASLAATSSLTVNAGLVAGTALAAASTLTVAGVPVRPATAALAGISTLTVAASSLRVGTVALAGVSTLTVEGVGPSYAQLRFQDMEATVTPLQGYYEPLPLTVGPNWQPGDVRFALVAGAATSGDAVEDVAMDPDPPTGYTAAYSPAPGFATEGVYYRYLADGDVDVDVAWPKPPSWRYWFWSLLSVRGVDPSTPPTAGRLTVNHTVGDAFCTVNSVSVPGPGVMVFLLGTTADLDGNWPAWPTAIGVPTDWTHLVATDKSGDKFFAYDANPALALAARKYTSSGSTGTVTFPLAQGAPAFIGMWMFVKGASDGVSYGSAITATDSVAAASSSAGTNPHSVGDPITATDSAGPGSNPVHGYIELPPYRLSGNPVEASRLQWAAVGDVTITTSINGGLSWDVAENWKPIPRLLPGDTTTRTVLFRATLTRQTDADPKPRLKWLRPRIGCRKLTDELIPTFYGPIDKAKTKIPAGSSGGTGSGGAGEGAFTRGGGMFGGGAVVKVHATDPSRLIKLAEWEQPFIGPSGISYTELGKSMVLDRSPIVPLFSQVSSGHTLDDSLLLWGLDQGGDPWADIRGVFTAIGHECYFGVAREFISRPVPDPRYGPVMWDFDHTVNPCIIGLESELDSSQIVNGWVIKGESSTSVNPVMAYAFNQDSSSRYNIFRPPVGIGKRIKRKTFPLAKTAQQCQDIANAALNKSMGLANTVKIRITPHPGIASGDVVRINSPETGVVGRFLVQGYELSDNPVAPMELTCFRQTSSA